MAHRCVQSPFALCFLNTDFQTELMTSFSLRLQKFWRSESVRSANLSRLKKIGALTRFKDLAGSLCVLWLVVKLASPCRILQTGYWRFYRRETGAGIGCTHSALAANWQDLWGWQKLGNLREDPSLKKMILPKMSAAGGSNLDWGKGWRGVQQYSPFFLRF